MGAGACLRFAAEESIPVGGGRRRTGRSPTGSGGEPSSPNEIPPGSIVCLHRCPVSRTGPGKRKTKAIWRGSQGDPESFRPSPGALRSQRRLAIFGTVWLGGSAWRIDARTRRCAGRSTGSQAGNRDCLADVQAGGCRGAAQSVRAASRPISTGFFDEFIKRAVDHSFTVRHYMLYQGRSGNQHVVDRAAISQKNRDV